MKKYILYGVVIVLFVAISSYVYYDISKYQIYSQSAVERKFSAGDLIDFQFHSRHDVDTSGLRESLRIVEGTPFTHIVRVGSRGSWDGQLNSGGNKVRIEFEDYNFNFRKHRDKRLLITFGRELHEIQFLRYIPQHGMETAITFAEEYHGDVMFFYLIDIMHLPPGISNAFYLMNGEERVYMGTSYSHLNEKLPQPTSRRSNQEEDSSTTSPSALQ